MATSTKQIAWGSVTANTTPGTIEIDALNLLGARTYILTLSVPTGGVVVYARQNSATAAISGEAVHPGSTWRSLPTDEITDWSIYAGSSQAVGYTVSIVEGER